MTNLTELLRRWDSNEGKPYKGRLIDWDAYKDDPQNIGCMCAQGQVLYLLGGWSPKKLLALKQTKADEATAKLLNISVAHAVLLRLVNDKADGAPSIVLTNPEKILGGQARTVLAFWLHLDGMNAKDWNKAITGAAGATESVWAAARAAVRDVTGAAVWAAARDAARDAAGAAARAAVRDVTGAAAGAAAGAAGAARDAAGAATGACGEIQGAPLMRESDRAFYFLPLFGFADPEAIPTLPANYGASR